MLVTGMLEKQNDKRDGCCRCPSVADAATLPLLPAMHQRYERIPHRLCVLLLLMLSAACCFLLIVRDFNIMERWQTNDWGCDFIHCMCQLSSSTVDIVFEHRHQDRDTSSSEKARDGRRNN